MLGRRMGIVFRKKLQRRHKNVTDVTKIYSCKLLKSLNYRGRDNSSLLAKSPLACGLKAEAGHNSPLTCSGRARGETVAHPLRGVGVARVARHVHCPAGAPRDSAR